ncbi:MAG TPA: hypothetical protein VN426_00180 [Syntrophomonadaceae bacterium]|nr:hypothetical protein [Syntrophomonadaceae bacterium]
MPVLGEVVGVNCSEAYKMFSLSLDQQLVREEELRLQDHLKGCLACSQELAEWRRVAEALHKLGQEEMSAPAGFSAALMARIDSEKASPSRVDWKRWKQVAIGTAAALLLTTGTLLIKPGSYIQLADQSKQVEQVQNAQSDAGKNNQPVQNVISNGNEQQPNSQVPDDKGQLKNNPLASTPNLSNIASTGDLLSTQNHIIISTLLKVKVDEVQKSEAAATNLVKTCGASLQSLGQQSEGGLVYRVDKIVVENNQAQQLIQSLSSLGTSTSSEQKEDLTQRYSELCAQLIALKNQRTQTQDSEQIASLDRQISQAEEQLHSWDVQTGKQTIVLWLQE